MTNSTSRVAVRRRVRRRVAVSSALVLSAISVFTNPVVAFADSMTGTCVAYPGALNAVLLR